MENNNKESPIVKKRRQYPRFLFIDKKKSPLRSFLPEAVKDNQNHLTENIISHGFKLVVNVL